MLRPSIFLIKFQRKYNLSMHCNGSKFSNFPILPWFKSNSDVWGSTIIISLTVGCSSSRSVAAALAFGVPLLFSAVVGVSENVQHYAKSRTLLGYTVGGGVILGFKHRHFGVTVVMAQRDVLDLWTQLLWGQFNYVIEFNEMCNGKRCIKCIVICDVRQWMLCPWNWNDHENIDDAGRLNRSYNMKYAVFASMLWILFCSLEFLISVFY